MAEPQITLTTRLSTSALDNRRGVVRLHPEVLDALGLRPWDAVRLTGARSTAALAAACPPDEPTAPGMVLVDDVTLSNLGLVEGAEVVVGPVEVGAAQAIVIAGSRLASTSLPPETVRLALIGKVLTTGDAVSMLPQDLLPADRRPGSDVITARQRLGTAVGLSWTTELLTVTQTRPPGPVAVRPSTVISWRDRAGPPGAAATTRSDSPATARGVTAAAAAGTGPAAQRSAARADPPVPVADLVGAREPAKRLTEWLDLALRRPELLDALGSTPRLGVLVSGPDGVGKATMVRSVAAALELVTVELAAPSVAALEAGTAAQAVADAAALARRHATEGPGGVLLLTNVDALLPAAGPPPLATVVLDTLREVVEVRGLALIATTVAPASVHRGLRAPDLLDRSLSIPLPDGSARTELLRVLLRAVPLAADVDLGAVAERAPGFVAADLVALRREAAVRAALRGHGTDGADPADPPPDGASRPPLTVGQGDLLGALEGVRPLSMSSSEVLAIGGITLDDVGDMVETKQALTEAVLWPLRYPDSFARLGIRPPRGVLLYGPPGCGKTFLIRALAGAGSLNVFSVKGAELLDKWVGESERAVRDLFARAADAAPALIFLDEVDALAPRRGQSSDAGVSDRVVAALLTELDGVEPMRDVVVLGSTNRPELIDPALLRPGRLERLVSVPPPDADARAAILASAARRTPLAADVSLPALAADLAGYSAADCTAVIREAALTAMRESLQAAEVTSAHVTAARAAVRPSLDPAQVADLAAWADAHRPG